MATGILPHGTNGRMAGRAQVLYLDAGHTSDTCGLNVSKMAENFHQPILLTKVDGFVTQHIEKHVLQSGSLPSERQNRCLPLWSQ